MVEQNENTLMARINKVIQDLDQFKSQSKKDKIDPSDFVRESDFQDQVDNLKREFRQLSTNMVSSNSNQP